MEAIYIMIVSFYDKNFKGLQNNASLVVANNSFNLIKRPIEMNSIHCICEPFTEDIQPTFLIVQNNKGNYVYGCFAGIPLLNKNNQTEINGTDLKSDLSSDIVLDKTLENFTTANDYITFIFNEWKKQVNQGSYPVELRFKDTVGTITLTDLVPSNDKAVINAYSEISKYLQFYNLYLDSEIDLVNKKVIFTVGKTMLRKLNIKLWEYGIKDYGKWVANINESQGYFESNGDLIPGIKWILTSQNKITNNPELRDIYPIKKKIVKNTESLQKANEEALTELLNSLYNENIELNANDILKNVDFETNFAIYLKRGQKEAYKNLPCGELHFNSNGLTKIQIGYRYSGVEFIS